MELGLGNTLLAGDPRLVDHIVGEVKSQGIFDQFRKECIADVDTKPAYQNLRTRVEGSVNSFLSKQTWKPDMNKNQLRENLRKHIHEAAYLDAGVERIVDQVVNPKVYSVFMPQIEDVVYKFLGLERPKDQENNGAKDLKDLLPKDLDPVSPESDKNSLKDVSLESVDAKTEETDATTGNEKQMKIFCDDESKSQDDEGSSEKPGKCDYSDNEQLDGVDKQLESSQKSLTKNVSDLNLNVSSKSDDKVEEEEEDSPMFEPIDIMNLNESNISNDSHLSGISELTSHRSRSPDFSNDFSRDNLDFSNQDSQLSKVSSDSRLSIVTDFGSSNHASTPMPEAFKEDSNRGRSKDSSDSKYAKDNFKAIREFESVKSNSKDGKNNSETPKSRDSIPEVKNIKDCKGAKGGLAVKDCSRDATDSRDKDKNDSKDWKEKSRDSDSGKAKPAKEKSDGKDVRNQKDNRKRQSSHSSTRNDKNEKYSKDKPKERSDKSRDNSDKLKDIPDKSKDSSEKPREDKSKDSDKKETAGKETKDLKDIYKEKIRELREKKELTEKEKLSKDNLDAKVTKESKVKKDSSKDRKDHKKEYRSSTSKSSTRHDEKPSKNEERSVSKSDGKPCGKAIDSKDSKKDKRHSNKESKNRTHSEKNEKSDVKKESKGEPQKWDGKKDPRNDSQCKDVEKNERSDAKKDSKTETQGKDKKRKDDKKSKAKDDHSSLRKNPNDRRSTDRDGSNGSNGKSSQKSGANSTSCSDKAVSSNMTKESSGTSNSGSETSDNIEASQSDELISLSAEPIIPNEDPSDEMKPLPAEMIDRDSPEPELLETGLSPKKVDLGQTELSLPLKKRPLQTECIAPNPGDFKVKKPKFAKNFYEAKKLMKIRKRLEKQRMREYEAAKEKFQLSNIENEGDSQPATLQDTVSTTPAVVSDVERVQIVEIPDEEYEQPYPEGKTSPMLEESSFRDLDSQSISPDTESMERQEKQSKLSEMESCIRKSLEEMISDKKLAETNCPTANNKDSNEAVQSNEEESSQDKQLEIRNESPEHEKPIDRSIESFEISCEISTNSQDSSNRKKIIDYQEPETIKITTEYEKIHEESAENPESKIVSNESEGKLEKAFNNEATNGNKSDDTENRKTLEVNTLHAFISNVKLSAEAADNSGTNNSASLERGESSAEITDDVKSSIKLETKSENDNEMSTKVPKEEQNDCLYLQADDESARRFSDFLECMELSEGKTMEEIIECLGGRLVSSLPKTMAPPRPKRKHSTSPLTDILLNNSNNNNDGHKMIDSLIDEGSKTTKKRRIGRPKKQRPNANDCPSQNLPNGENFVMPLSPESDVSATSEKTPSHPIKEEKSRQRSSQRYSSDDLYKPRPFFSSSSRRSRRSNQS